MAAFFSFGRLSTQGENTSKASSTSGEYLKNHYDSYSFVGSTGFTGSLYTSDTSQSGWGKLTGQVIGIPGSSTKIYVAYYYDAKGRVVRKVESNLLGGHEVTETTYTFTGNPLKDHPHGEVHLCVRCGGKGVVHQTQAGQHGNRTGGLYV